MKPFPEDDALEAPAAQGGDDDGFHAEIAGEEREEVEAGAEGT